MLLVGRKCMLFCKGMRGSSFYATHNTFNNVLHRTGAAKSRLVAESKCWPDLDFCYKWHGVFDGREEPGIATAPSSYCPKATRIQKVRGTCPPRWRHWPCWPSPSWSARWRTSYQPSPGAQIYLDFFDRSTWIRFVGGSKSFFLTALLKRLTFLFQQSIGKQHRIWGHGLLLEHVQHSRSNYTVFWF